MIIMTRPSANIIPVCFSYVLVITLLLQCTQPVQSLALSSLCGQFGHSCFGGNWGKRESPTSAIRTDLTHSNADAIAGDIVLSDEERALIKSLLVEETRMSLFQQRLRQLLKLE